MSNKTLADWMRYCFRISDFEGQCSFLYNDQLELSIEASNDDEFVVLSAGLANLSDNTSKAQLVKIMQMDYLGIDTNGTTISIDDSGEHIELWYQCAVEGLDTELFQNLVGSFIDTALTASEKISSILQQTEASRVSSTQGVPGRFVGNQTPSFRV